MIAGNVPCLQSQGSAAGTEAGTERQPDLEGHNRSEVAGGHPSKEEDREVFSCCRKQECPDRAVPLFDRRPGVAVHRRLCVALLLLSFSLSILFEFL